MKLNNILSGQLSKELGHENRGTKYKNKLKEPRN